MKILAYLNRPYNFQKIFFIIITIIIIIIIFLHILKALLIFAWEKICFLDTYGSLCGFAESRRIPLERKLRPAEQQCLLFSQLAASN